MNALYIVLIVLGGVLALLLTAAYLLFRFSCARRQKAGVSPDFVGTSFEDFYNMISESVEAAKAAPHEEVSITAFDGLTLRGLLFLANGSSRTVVCMHGYRSRGLFDYGPHIAEYVKRGYNVLVPDQRGCGDSGGRYITFGVRERRDCRDWVSFAVTRFGANSSVFLHGLSLGCATVLMATGLSLPENVRGIIADCGFTSPYEECAHVMKTSMKLPTFPLLPLANFWCRLLAGFSLRECDTAEILKTNTIPILFIHGQLDSFVPTRMTDRNYECDAGEKYYFRAAHSSHAMSFFDEPEAFRAQQFGFLDAH